VGIIDPLLETREAELKPQISWLGKKYNALLEKYKGKTVQKVVEETKEEVERSNRYDRGSKCSCGGNLVNRIIGTEGLFTRTSTVNHCTKCERDYREYSTKKYLDSELKEKRIKKVGNEYRYMFWGLGYSFMLYVLIMLLLFSLPFWFWGF